MGALADKFMATGMPAAYAVELEASMILQFASQVWANGIDSWVLTVNSFMANAGSSQVNADWNATSGVARILNKPALFDGTWLALTGKPTFSPVATSGSYADLSNKPALFDGTWGSLSGKPTFAAVATSGSYTDLVNRPARSFAQPARSLNASFQISTTRDTFVSYSVNISVTSALIAGQEGRVHLEYADDSGFTTNVVTVASAVNATSGVLNLTNIGAGNVTGWIPVAKYVRIRTENVTGAPTYSLTRVQEVQQ